MRASASVFHVACAIGLMSTSPVAAQTPTQTEEPNPPHDYAQALHLNYLFYHAQKSGTLDEHRLAWRTDSCSQCTGPEGEDLSRGYFEAANTMKWGFPYAFMLTQNAWGAIEFAEGMRIAQEHEEAKRMVKWGTDYLVNAYSSYRPEHKDLSDEDFVDQFRFVGHLGNSDVDFEYFGPAGGFEDWADRMNIPMADRRPAYYVNKTTPSTEICAESAAALAAAHILLKDDHPEYADKLLAMSKQLLRFGMLRLGTYMDAEGLGWKQAAAWYPSSDYVDEIAWAAAWIFRATRDYKYLEIAEKHYQSGPGGSGGWGYSWDEKGPGLHALMLLVGGPSTEQYSANFHSYLDSWLPGPARTIPHTPGGLGYPYHWGANRYSANTAFISFVYAKVHNMALIHPSVARAGFVDKVSEYGTSLVNYMLGSNPENYSWIVGYGEKYPLRPYHKTSYNSVLNYPLKECICKEGSVCGPTDQSHYLIYRCQCEREDGSICDSIKDNELDFTLNNDRVNQHILYGALVGGPAKVDDKPSDVPIDTRLDYEFTEVTQDYNAAVSGIMAAMIEQQYPTKTIPFSDCTLDLGWDFPGAPARDLNQYEPNDCYHRCDCTPTPSPTRLPTVPTLAPTPYPTIQCPNGIFTDGSNNCLTMPDCCGSGLACYKKDDVTASCIASCEAGAVLDGDNVPWSCQVVKPDAYVQNLKVTVEQREMCPYIIFNEEENCMENPGCCAAGTVCYTKDSTFASCKQSCDTEVSGWDCIVADPTTVSSKAGDAPATVEMTTLVMVAAACAVGGAVVVGGASYFVAKHKYQGLDPDDQSKESASVASSSSSMRSAAPQSSRKFKKNNKRNEVETDSFKREMVELIASLKESRQPAEAPPSQSLKRGFSLQRFSSRLQMPRKGSKMSSPRFVNGENPQYMSDVEV